MPSIRVTYSNIYAKTLGVNGANIPQPPAVLPNGSGELPDTAKYAPHFKFDNLRKLFADGSDSVSIPLQWIGLPANAIPTPLDAAYEQMTEDMLSNQPAATQVASTTAFIAAYNAAPAATRAPWLAIFNAATARLATMTSRMSTPPARNVLTGEIHFVYFERLENDIWVPYLRVEHVSNAIRNVNNDNIVQPERNSINSKFFQEDTSGNRRRTDSAKIFDRRNVTMTIDQRNLRIGLNLLIARCGNTSFFSLNGGNGVLGEKYSYPRGATDSGAYYVTLKIGAAPTGINVEIPDWNDFNFTAIQNAAIALCTANQYSPAVAEGYRQRAHRAVVRQQELLESLRALSAANGNPAELQNLITIWQARVAQNETTLNTLAQFQANASCFTAGIGLTITRSIGFVPASIAPSATYATDIIAIATAIDTRLNIQTAEQIINVAVPNEAPLAIRRSINKNTLEISLNLVSFTRRGSGEATVDPAPLNTFATLVPRRGTRVLSDVTTDLQGRGWFVLGVPTSTVTSVFNATLPEPGNSTQITPIVNFRAGTTFNHPNPELRRITEVLTNPL